MYILIHTWNNNDAAEGVSGDAVLAVSHEEGAAAVLHSADEADAASVGVRRGAAGRGAGENLASWGHWSAGCMHIMMSAFTTDVTYLSYR